MYIRSLRLPLAAAVLGGLLSATTASAQMDPEGGDVWVPPADTQAQPPPQQQQPPPQQQQPWYQGQPQQQPPPPARPVQAQPQPTPAQPSDGRDDHQRVINRLAVGFMGSSVVPIGDLTATATNGVGTVTTPAIGIRYWLGDLVGIDVGLGLGFIGGNVDTSGGTVPVDNAFAMLIHGGVPLAIYHEQHYKFVIIPEVNLGFSTGTHYIDTNPDNDRGRSGFLFEVGGRLGTEIHFGFMDIPQLSLQASVGLYFRYQSAGISGSRSNPSDRANINTYSLGTTVQGEPWDILLGSLTALYYF